MFKRNWRLFVEDMLESIELIEKYINKLDLSGFKDDRKTVDAVVRNFEIIGEASKFIPDEVKEEHSEVDWQAILDFEIGWPMSISGLVCQSYGRLSSMNCR